MNILYINHYAGSPDHGMEYRPYYLAREWSGRGHRVQIIAASQSHVRRRAPTTAGRFTREMIGGIEYVWCATPGYEGNGVGRVVNIGTFVWRLMQWRGASNMKPDVVIASSTYPLDIYAARRLARHFGAQLVWEVHDLWPLSPVELGGMSRRHPFIMLLQHAEDTACRAADIVISMLPKADTHLHAHGMARAKFHFIPNGIDPSEWQDDAAHALPAAHADAIRAARQRGHMLVAYAGAHGIANALHTVLDTAAGTRDDPVTWLLVGNGPERGALAARVAAEQLSNVIMLEAVPKASIPTLLRAMDVLYIGLQREPLFRFGISPNKLMDYMMAARPIICAIEAGNDPVSEAGCGLTIEAENPAALAAAVRRMHELAPAQREHMGMAGRAYVETHHLYRVLAQQFLEILQKRAA